MKGILGTLLLLVLTIPAFGQTTPQVNNWYAAGVSYNVGGSPSVAGTALYARLADADTHTYLFTNVDALPASTKPFSVTTNIGAGVAQKLFTFTVAKAAIDVYVPTAAGISFNGTNTGWQWNAGGLASIPIKGTFRLMPTIRFMKSSVSGNSGYQPIIGLLAGWGQ